MNKFGLTHRQINLLKKIFAENDVDLNKVKIFGSRATENYKENSDIDLVVFDNILESKIDTLWTIFHESSIPYKVDICAYNFIKSYALKEHIDLFSKPIFNIKL